jgi:hypothetical protein
MHDSRLSALIHACYAASARRLGNEGRAQVYLAVDAAGRAAIWWLDAGTGFSRLDSAVDYGVGRLKFQSARRKGARGRGGRPADIRLSLELTGGEPADVCYAPAAPVKTAPGRCLQSFRPTAKVAVAGKRGAASGASRRNGRGRGREFGHATG